VLHIGEVVMQPNVIALLPQCTDLVYTQCYGGYRTSQQPYSELQSH
jgi:hypothetical protein